MGHTAVEGVNTVFPPTTQIQPPTDWPKEKIKVSNCRYLHRLCDTCLAVRPVSGLPLLIICITEGILGNLFYSFIALIGV